MAEWPDEVFEEVGKALPSADQMATGLQKLESMWWAEKRRRDAAQVCGAVPPWWFDPQLRSIGVDADPSCVNTDCNGDPHQYGGIQWSDSCGRPHMSEVAERVIKTALEACFRHELGCYSTASLSPTPCWCGAEALGEAIIAYDQEANRD